MQMALAARLPEAGQWPFRIASSSTLDFAVRKRLAPGLALQELSVIRNTNRQYPILSRPLVISEVIHVANHHSKPAQKGSVACSNGDIYNV